MARPISLSLRCCSTLSSHDVSKYDGKNLPHCWTGNCSNCHQAFVICSECFDLESPPSHCHTQSARYYGLFVGQQSLKHFRAHHSSKHAHEDNKNISFDSANVASEESSIVYSEYASSRYLEEDNDPPPSQCPRISETCDKKATSLSQSHMPQNSRRFYNQYMNVVADLVQSTSDEDDPAFLGRLECLRELVYFCFNKNQRDQSNVQDMTGMKAGSKETILHILCAMLCAELTESQLSLVNTLMLLILNNTGEGTTEAPKERLFVSTSMPSTVQSWKRHYTQGSSSLLKLLPSENVERLKHHAVVDPISTLEHMLASGVTFADYTTLGNGGTTAADTPVNRKVKELAGEQNVMPVGVQLFSDGFRASAVTNKASCWVLEMFCSPPGNLRRGKAHSHILAIGPSSADHEEVFEYIFERLSLLKSPRLCLVGAVGRAVPCLFQVTCYSADLPERASILNALTFKSNTHKRFGKVMYIPNGDWVAFHLHSCRACFLKRSILLGIHSASSEGTSMPSTGCQCCSDWNYKHPRNRRRMTDKHYPTKLHPNSPPCPPGREVGAVDGGVVMKELDLTFELMTMASDVAHFNYSAKTWTKANAECYMKYCAVNGKRQYEVCESAKTNHSLLLPSRKGAAYREFREQPAPLIHPAICRTKPFAISCFIESILHLLFEGIHDDLMDKLIPAVLSLKSMNTKAMICYNNFLQEVRSHNLSWLNVYPLLANSASNKGSSVTYSTAGWTGANQMSSARLIKVGFSHVRDILPESTAGDSDFIEKFDLFEAMLQAYHAVAARVMQPNSSSVTCEEIDNYVKIFLSLSLRFSQLTETGQNTPYTFRGGNCLGLLNLSGQRASHGSPRDSDTWDGDYERGIQLAKDFLQNVRMTSSFFETKLTTACNKKTLDIMFDELSSMGSKVTGVEINNGGQESRRGGKPKVYPDIGALQDALDSGSSLHGILYPDNGVMKAAFLLQVGNNRNCVAVHAAKFLDEGGTALNGCWFADVTVQTDIPMTFLPTDQALSLSRIGLFRKPWKNNQDLHNPEQRGGFYTTTDNWLDRSSTGHFELPIMDKNLVGRVLGAWPL